MNGYTKRLLILAGLLSPAAQGATLDVLGPSTVAPGASFQLSVQAQGLDPNTLSGGFWLDYDPSLFSVTNPQVPDPYWNYPIPSQVSIKPGGRVEVKLASWAPFSQSISSSSSSSSLSGLGSSTPTLGSTSTLLTLNVTALGTGTGTFKLGSIMLNSSTYHPDGIWSYVQPDPIYIYTTTYYSPYCLTGCSGNEPSINMGSLTLTVSAGTTPVPLPPALWLFSSALAGLVGVGRRLARRPA